MEDRVEEFLQISSQRKREMGETRAQTVCKVNPGVPTAVQGSTRGKEQEKRGEALFEQVVARGFPELKKRQIFRLKEYTEWRSCEFLKNET